MAKSNATHPQTFDAIVIGSGLSGLITSQLLVEAGRTVLLVESRDVLGGTTRAGENKFSLIDYGAKLFCENSSDELNQAQVTLAHVLRRPIEFERIEAAAVTYDDGKFKPYVGFGDSTLQTVAVIEQYSRPNRLIPVHRPFIWAQLLETRLRSEPNCTILTQATVTRIHFETRGEGRNQKQVATSIIVNGTKTYFANETVIFAAPANELMSVVDPALLPQKFRTRALKGEMWTSLHLDLIHSEAVTDSQSVHVLKGANEEPCFGEFLAPAADGSQVSQWTTFVPRDQTDDEEAIANGLKQIKKQLKRAYESSQTQLVGERILVVPSSHADLSGLLDDDLRIPKVDGLLIASSLLVPGNPVLRSVTQAQRAVDVILGTVDATADSTENNSSEASSSIAGQEWPHEEPSPMA